jgi:hypothetical protein
MHKYLGWQIDIQYLGVGSYTFQAFCRSERYISPQVFDSWDRTYMAAQEWVSMHIARDTAINLLDVLWEDGQMSHQEHDFLVNDLRRLQD